MGKSKDKPKKSWWSRIKDKLVVLLGLVGIYSQARGIPNQPCHPSFGKQGEVQPDESQSQKAANRSMLKRLRKELKRGTSNLDENLNELQEFKTMVENIRSDQSNYPRYYISYDDRLEIEKRFKLLAARYEEERKKYLNATTKERKLTILELIMDIVTDMNESLED